VEALAGRGDGSERAELNPPQDRRKAAPPAYPPCRRERAGEERLFE